MNVQTCSLLLLMALTAVVLGDDFGSHNYDFDDHHDLYDDDDDHHFKAISHNHNPHHNTVHGGHNNHGGYGGVTHKNHNNHGVYGGVVHKNHNNHGGYEGVVHKNHNNHVHKNHNNHGDYEGVVHKNKIHHGGYDGGVNKHKGGHKHHGGNQIVHGHGGYKNDKHGHGQDYYAPARYAFAYGVDDPYYGTNFGHAEERDGKRVEGEYHVHLPDGRIQKVSYYADETGYHPTITYIGQAKYPSPPNHKKSEYY